MSKPNMSKPTLISPTSLLTVRLEAIKLAAMLHEGVVNPDVVRICVIAETFVDFVVGNYWGQKPVVHQDENTKEKSGTLA